MALLTRKIKRQIHSIKNTQKITKAMELVSASKMRKAINAVLASRPYSKLAWQMVNTLSQGTSHDLHELLKPREPIKKVGVVLISANRGLCGVFNQQVMREALKGILPEKIRTRQDKIGFATPEEIWMRGELGKEMKKVFASASFNSRGYFEKGKTLEMFEKYLKGKITNYQLFWRLYCLEMWFRVFID